MKLNAGHDDTALAAELALLRRVGSGGILLDLQGADFRLERFARLDEGAVSACFTSRRFPISETTFQYWTEAVNQTRNLQ